MLRGRLVRRVDAVRALAALSTNSASATLFAATTDRDAQVRVAACQGLATRQDPNAIPALQHVLGSDTDIDVRLAATRALGVFQDRAAIGALAIALDDPDPALQYRAMQSLKTASGQNYGTDLVAWRQFVRGENPTVKGTSLAERFRNWF